MGNKALGVEKINIASEASDRDSNNLPDNMSSHTQHRQEDSNTSTCSSNSASAPSRIVENLLNQRNRNGFDLMYAQQVQRQYLRALEGIPSSSPLARAPSISSQSYQSGIMRNNIHTNAVTNRHNAAVQQPPLRDPNQDSQFIMIAQRIRRLEEERDRLIMERDDLQLQFQSVVDVYEQEITAIERNYESIKQDHSRLLKNRSKGELDDLNILLKQDLTDKLTCLNKHVFPERMQMAEEDELAFALRELDRERDAMRKKLKEEYTVKLKYDLKISKQEFRKVVAKFQEGRDEEYEKVKYDKVTLVSHIF